ncbi:MAG: hypothetical protein CL454_00135 [Acidimicrobiaceae bacterium]|nr:hypothetical protein [Acidimicrobiaceae bacterium]|tara:strand:+ start:528 stop:1010 length:483 start_codon:yes stop_codon:yes gene_type:complete
MTSTTVRAPSDPAVKQFMNTRAKTVRVLVESGMSPREAREYEYGIYRRAHTSVDIYLNTAVKMLRGRRRNSGGDSGGGGGGGSGGGVVTTTSGVSASRLQSFFHINWEDILSEEGRFALAQCAKCRSREIYTITAQLRSADEGMSVICTCQRCGEQWTQR